MECVRWLTDLEFVEAKCANGLVDELVVELETALHRGSSFSGSISPSGSSSKPGETPSPSGTDGADGGGADFSSGLSQADRSRLIAYHRIVARNAHILRKAPDLFFQLAANSPPSLAPAVDALELSRSPEGEDLEWLKQINLEKSDDPCLTILEGHSYEVLDAKNEFIF